MILALCMTFCMLGSFFMVYDLFIPFPLPLALVFSIRLMGMGFTFIGLMILGGRIYQTRISSFIDLPNSKRVILLHQRRGKNPNTSILEGKLTDLEFIRTKNKIFVDTGGSFRIAGHDVRRTHETICHDIPEWLSQYFYEIKNKYLINNFQEFHQLYKQLQKIHKPLPGAMTIEDQLNQIPLLEPVMNDNQKKQTLLNMNLNDLKNMSEYLFDGKIHHGEEVESFIESATPNELDTLEKQSFLNEMRREKNYAEPGEINWGQWLPLIAIFLVCAALAFAIIKGVI